MALAISVLLQTGLATLALLLLVLPCGYLIGWAFNVLAFRGRSVVEQALWTTALSAPVSIALTCVVGRFLPALGTLSLLLSFMVCCLLLLIKRATKRKLYRNFDRHVRLFALLMLAEAFYIGLAGVPFQASGKLFEPVFSSDWEIRLPLIEAAVRDVLPRNPFFTLHGNSPLTRYYYYWYTLCAQPIRLVHVQARPALLASSIYASLVIISTMLLYLKYMVRSPFPLRRRAFLMLLLCCVLGLDVLPSLLGLFLFHARLLPEVEWWATDRSPGLPGALLYAPHHVAGVAMGLLGFLILVVWTGQPGSLRRAHLLKCAVLIAIIFSALVGTSTFICMFFAAACALLAIFGLLRGNSRYAGILVMAGVLSLLASSPYLHQLLSAPKSLPSPAGHAHMLRIRLRDIDQTHKFLDSFYLFHLHRPIVKAPWRFLYRVPMFPLLWLNELGVFLFVVILQFRRDFRSTYRPSFAERSMWVLAACLLPFFFLLSSAPIQGVNDLGVQAGLVMRLIFVIWGAQVAAQFLATHPVSSPIRTLTWPVRVAYLFLVLGITLTIWQAVVERFYLVLLDRNLIPNSSPFPQAAHVASVYNDIYEAQQAVNRLLPRDAVVQSDPVARYQTIFRLYQQRREAAGDASCEGAFGGDYVTCQELLLPILKLYGTREKRPEGTGVPMSSAADRLVQPFAAVCSQVGLSALLASRLDPAWYQADSWVWKADLLYNNQTVRLLRCPQNSTTAQLYNPR